MRLRWRTRRPLHQRSAVEQGLARVERLLAQGGDLQQEASEEIARRVGAEVVRGLERSEARARLIRSCIAIATALVVLVASLVLWFAYLHQHPQVSFAASAPSPSSLQGWTLANPTGQSSELVLLDGGSVVIGASGREAHGRASDSVAVVMPVGAADCRRLRGVGFGCGGQPPKRRGRLSPGAEVDLDFPGGPQLMSLRESSHGLRSLRLSRSPGRHGDAYTLEPDGSSQLDLSPGCVGVRSVEITVDGNRSITARCREGGMPATAAVRFRPDFPPAVTITGTEQIASRLRATALRASVRSASLRVSDTAQQVFDAQGADLRIGGRSAGTTVVAELERTSASSLSLTGSTTSVRLAGKELVGTRYSRESDIWLAIAGLAASLLLPGALVGFFDVARHWWRRHHLSDP